MIYLEKIKITKDYLGNLKKGLEIQFKQLNLFVGEQGCGKSSLLGLLNPFNPDLPQNVFRFDDSVNFCELIFNQKNLSLKGGGVNTHFFDTETMNPRIVDPKYKQNEMNDRDIIVSKWQSHGEPMVYYTVEGIAKAKDCVMFFDEPESALSPRNQYRLIESIQMAMKNDVQLFIATHNILLIEFFDDVYSLEHKTWMKASDFLKSQKIVPKPTKKSK